MASWSSIECMFDVRPAGTQVLAGMANALSSLTSGTDDSERIDRIRLLEELKSAAAAAQARETAAFADSQRAAQLAAGVPAEQANRGIAAQVGLAKRVSPFHAQRYVGWSAVLTSELPATFGALQKGRISEWRAMIVARETAWLSREHRAEVDRELAPRLESLGDRRVEAEAKKLAYRLDPAGYLARVRGADADRRVSLRPAPDTMCRLTGFLPVAQGVAAYAALTREADALIGHGDGRSRGQIMADTMVERLTGQAEAGDVPVEINLVMTDETLFGTSPCAESESAAPAPTNDGEAAILLEYGPIPPAVARQLVLGPQYRTPMWLRRLYRAPGTGELAAMDSRRRLFTANQRHFLMVRDQTCRTPWCDAPIRHVDHVIPASRGGPTSVTNGQGYCAACNYAKQAPGWRTERPPDESAVTGEFVITTPTGHRYRHRPPDLPGVVPRPFASDLERRFAELLRAA